MFIIKKIQLFFALSRTFHVLLDIANPALIALLTLGTFPNTSTVIIGIITAFSGYNAIYALNDLLSIQVDREKMVNSESYLGYAVESNDLRHPLAQRFLKKWEGWLWFAIWFCIAMIGASILSFVSLGILLAGGVLEILYVLLFKRHYLRIIISGMVKSCGPLAAIFAVYNSPSIYFVIAVFFWVFLWEIGGQNLPADWNDKEEDKKIHAKTIPVIYGHLISNRIILITSTISIIASLWMIALSPISISWITLIIITLVGIMFFLRHAWALYLATPHVMPEKANRLFNWASYYPLALLIVFCFRILIEIL